MPVSPGLMRPLALFACLSMSTHANAASRWWQREPEQEDPLKVCDRDADRVTFATHPAAAREALKTWLQCVEGTQTHPPDLGERLAEVVHASRYDAVLRAESQVIAYFTDRSTMKELPGTPAEGAAYLERAAAQALYARAAGDFPYAQALDQRADRLRKLQSLIDRLEG